MKDSILLFLVLFPLISSFVSYLIGRKNKVCRDYFAMSVCVIDVAILFYLFTKVAAGNILELTVPNICGQNLYFRLDGFRAIYATVCAFMWSMTTIFSHEYFHHYRNRNRYYFFLLLTFAGTMGVFLSGDIFTTFVFFEIMSTASYMMVIHDEKPQAMRAGDTYLMIGVLGGMVMLMGIFMLYNAIGTLKIHEIHDAVVNYTKEGLDAGRVRYIWASALCMLFGFGAKSGMFPVHIWLPKAHPVAPAPASALLSGILTKSGVYGILIITSQIFFANAVWGNFILGIGTITMFLGAFLALFSVDLKRTLACSSMSQIGFILIACGMQAIMPGHIDYAARGALLHMVNHSVFKLILFMCAGVVYMNLHKLNLNDVRGFGRGKWLLNFAFLMGYIGIAGVPLWSGYISKTLIHDSILHYLHELHHEGVHGFWKYDIYGIVEWIFTISGGLTFAYMTKLYICLFIEKNADKKVQEKYDSLNKTYMTSLSKFAIGLSALIPPMFGLSSILTTTVEEHGEGILLNDGLMDKLAQLGKTFMVPIHEHIHDSYLNYYSWDCVSGALKSLFIGACVYLLIIRPLLMKKTSNGVREYVNRWPACIDLEDYFYRPLIMNVLVGILGAICSVLDKLIDPILKVVIFVCGFVFRVLDKLVDGFVYIFKTLFLSIMKAGSEDRIFSVLNEDSQSSKLVKVVTNSLAYSLILFCIGLTLALIYLLFMR